MDDARSALDLVCISSSRKSGTILFYLTSRYDNSSFIYCNADSTRTWLGLGLLSFANFALNQGGSRKIDSGGACRILEHCSLTKYCIDRGKIPKYWRWLPPPSSEFPPCIKQTKRTRIVLLRKMILIVTPLKWLNTKPKLCKISQLKSNQGSPISCTYMVPKMINWNCTACTLKKLEPVNQGL